MLRRVSHFSDLQNKLLGAATAISINKITFTEPATGATLTLADGATFATVGAFASTFTFTGITGVTFPTSGTLATTETYTAASTACTGAITTAVIWKATKTSNQITLTLPATSGSAVAASTIVYGVALPASFRPAASLAFPVLVRDNGTNQTTPGMIIINTSGVITIYRDATGASFTNASTCGLAQSIGTGLSWTI